MRMRKSKADQTMDGICIILSNISRGIAFLHQGVTNCLRRLLRSLDPFEANKQTKDPNILARTKRSKKEAQDPSKGSDQHQIFTYN